MIKTGFLLILNLILAVLLGLALLYIVFLLPTEKMDQNVRKAAFTISEEGVYPKLSSSFTSTLDNFTDSIMLLEAADDRDVPTLTRAVSAYRGGMNYSDNPADVLVGHYVWDYDFETTLTYLRYWHGYLVFLKPLLMLTDYHGIRVVNGIVHALLVLFCAYLFIKRKKDLYAIPWMLGYFMLMPLVLAKSLQYSSCFYVFVIGSLALLLIKDTWKFAPFIFLNIGIATAFFDYLTYPIATFGVPMAVCLVLMENAENKLVSYIWSVIKNGIFWCIGYAGMWVSKWVVTSIIKHYDVVSEALGVFQYRTSDTEAGVQFSRGSVVAGNFYYFLRTPVIYITLICLVYLIYTLIKNKASHSAYAWKKFIPYLIVSLAPVVWYCFALNHSGVHVFFANKACIVSYVSLLFGLISVSETRDVAVEMIQTSEQEVTTDGQNSSTDSVLE